MRIGTWNVEYAAGREKNARRLRRILDAACDVWVLTETHDELDLGPSYRCIATTGRATGRDGARWTAIWTTYPISTVLAVEDPNRTAAALLASPTGPLLVYGTVLPWHSDRGPNGDAQAWSEHHRVIEVQAREWRALRNAHPDAGFCLAGDLNMNLAGGHYYGTARGRASLRAGLAEAGLECVTARACAMLERLRHPPIDHVCLDRQSAATAFVSGAWEGTDEGLRLSDHSAVVVDVPPFR